MYLFNLFFNQADTETAVLKMYGGEIKYEWCIQESVSVEILL